MGEGARGVPGIDHMPALDGLRAVALLGVLAFHGGFSAVRGGYLPLTTFFVLSGFLITALLLSERLRTGRNDVAAFWERRVRRLAPAALAGIVLVALYVRLATTPVATTVQGDVVASMAWMTNWRFIVSDQPYAEALTDPSPVQHYWSLAVEEQFYLVLPVLFVALLAIARGRRWLFATAAGVLAAGSVAWMAHLHEPGEPPLRAYFGTDTRAAELLVGVMLACLLVTRSGGIRRLPARVAPLVGVAGAAALGATVATWFFVDELDDRLYEGGLVAVALLAALVIAAASQPGATVARVLGWRPLVWIGRRSYGLYVYHWPIFLLVDERSTGLGTVSLFALRMVLTSVLAELSLRLLEQPIREGRAPRGLALVGWVNGSVAATAVVAVALASATLPSVTLDTGAQEGELPPRPVPAVAEVAAPVVATTTVPTTVPTTAPPREALEITVPRTVASAAVAPAAAPVSAPTTVSSTAPPTTTAPTTTTTVPPPAPVRVMVVGDSLARNIATGLAGWAAEGAAIEVYDASISGCTYSRGGVRHLDSADWPVGEECGWWATSTFGERAAEFRPDVIVSHIGHNEMYDRSHPSWEGPRAPGDPLVDDYITTEWTSAASAFVATGVPVVWLTAPCVDTDRWPGRIDNDEANRRLDHLNRAYTSIVDAQTSVLVADLDLHVCADGFSDVVDGESKARPDGFHLSDRAATAVARSWLGPIVVRAAGR